MTRQFGYDEIVRDDRAVITTGTFDGVHRGHQAIVRYLVARARRVGGASTVVTFDPHPREVLGRGHVPLLTTLDERADLLEALGVDRFVVLPFTRDLSLLEPEDYVEDVLLGTVGVREVVVGYDHRFGRGRRGDRALLEALGRRHGFSVDVIPEQVVAGITVSSTQVRRVLAEDGDAARATALLGRPYRLAGTVVRGDQRGRDLGFPTANLLLDDPRKLVPRHGIYAVRATLARRADGRAEGARVGGVMSVGRRPTFEADGAVKPEVHLFDFAGDLYGTRLAVDLVAWVRPEERFGSAEALVARMHEDAAQARAALGAVS